MALDPKPLLPKSKDWAQLTIGLRRSLPATMVPLLQPIDDELKLYEATFSNVAKRNIAADIQRHLGSWSRQWKALKPRDPLPGLIQQLVEQARDAVAATGAPSHRRYSDAVCVSYCINTGKFDANQFVEYDGKADDRTDMALRCSNMITAIQESWNASEAQYPSGGATDGILRIFMAPEFYFRGLYGAYTSDVVFDILPLLRHETNKIKYKHWVFVFGTAIMASFVEETVCPTCKQTLGDNNSTKVMKGAATALRCRACNVEGATEKVGAMIDNVAFVQKGGELGDRNTFVVTKEYISGIDFRRVVPGVAHANNLPDWWDVANRGQIALGQGASTTPLPVAGSRQDWSPVGRTFGASRFSDERMGGAIFEMDGIRFGLEICLDHAKNRLGGASNIQIQLVPSAGMQWQQYAVGTGGLYFGVDAFSGAQVGVANVWNPPALSSSSVSVGGTVQVWHAATFA